MKNLFDSFGSAIFRRAMAEAMLVGAFAGIVGVHVMLRKLSFFVVAMSHATFPGIAIASALGISLFLGGTAFGLLVVAAVLLFGSGRALNESSIIGVILGGSFALGVLVISARPGSSKDLTSFLVGSILTVTSADLLQAAVAAVVVLGVLALLHKELVFGAFDPVGMIAVGYSKVALDAVVLTAVTVTMVIAIPSVGTLLAVSLLTVPAVTARLWTDTIRHLLLLSALFGSASGLIGLCASAIWRFAAGGSIVMTAGLFFVLSLGAKQFSSRVSAPADPPRASAPASL